MTARDDPGTTQTEIATPESVAVSTWSDTGDTVTMETIAFVLI